MPKRRISAWLECMLAAADLVCWSSSSASPTTTTLPLRNRCLPLQDLAHGRRITLSGQVVQLRLDHSWFWAKALALGFDRLRAAFARDAIVGIGHERD